MNISKTIRKPKNIIFAVIGLVVIAIIAIFVSRAFKKPQVNLVAVKRGAIVQNVIVTGKTKPVDTINLAFEKGGKITHVYARVGDKVHGGQLIAQQETDELSAQLLQAKASVEAQQAKLDELNKGTRLEDIRVKETELKKAQQDLENYYDTVTDVVNDAYVKADDAARHQVTNLFTQDESASPQLSFTTNDSQAKIDAETQRTFVSKELNTWKQELSQLGSSHSASDMALAQAKNHLTVIRTFLNRLMDALAKASALSASTIDTYKTSVVTARNNINTALTNVNTQSQNILSQTLTVERISSELKLKQAGTTSEQIRAQEAQIKQAQSQVQSAQAQINKASLYSPIEGVVTKQNAKPGEIAAPNSQLVSIISDTHLVIEANVPEVDIGKIIVGDSVSITLDALPGETFQGKVTYVDPAETVIDGVVNFKITITFTTLDPRFKSGLTANLSIETLKKESVLILPQYAVLEKDQGTFIKIQDGSGNAREVPIIMGIRSTDGMVEIISGVQEAQEVVNIGSKTP